ncbi:hypothetical protein MSR1_06310 [Magnetospirillum gryphiswaldense MSR-1]|nr:hypothetical protein MSR1_06310 [Magnetospirillum gryphiswaldense MSR-1]AVM77044.1 hypothetical protein MSR1L_06310 [Magnetospirillum gryphiswaldense]
MHKSEYMRSLYEASFHASHALGSQSRTLEAAIAEARKKHAPALIGASLERYRPSQQEDMPVTVICTRRQRGPSRRMVQQRRAAHARARWPWKLQTQWPWTDAEVCLIDALLYLGGASGEFDVYRSELENRAGVRPSTQRAAEAKLRDLSLLEVVENRREYDRNDANSYQLKGVLKEAARILWVRRGEGTKLCAPFGGLENQEPHTSPTLAPPTLLKWTPGRRPPVTPEPKARAERFDHIATGVPTSPQSGEVCKLLGRNEQAKPAAANAAGDGVAETVALDLIRSFLPEVAPAEAPPDSVDDALALADRLQRTYAPTLWPHVWRAWRKRWGLTAVLAVLETGLMRRGGQIETSGAQYLSGILGRNRRQAPAPEATLQAMRASRRAPGLALGRSGRGARS